MKIIYYCQYVLGVGHFFRSLEICRQLSEHEVILVTGGTPIDVVLPAHVRQFHLPEIMMDHNFDHLLSKDSEQSLNHIKILRRKYLYNLVQQEKPDIIFIELYPFGRKAFRFELDPILKAIRNKILPSSRVICSLRDILVEKNNPDSYETRVIETLNRYFDALLIHSDPELIKLDETFSKTKEISIPIAYTGFVTPKPLPNTRRKLRQELGLELNAFLILASAGGGNVGASLLENVINAFQFIEKENPFYLIVFTGPFMSEEKFNHLNKFSNNQVRIHRFTSDFVSYLAAADLSISMAGYNTCLNILAARVPALVWPFSQNREQKFRAEKLAQMGALQILEDKDLKPFRLAAVINQVMSRRFQPSKRIDLNGSINTAKWLKRWMHNIGNKS
ncbi:MAG: glycosyl transferase [Desulfobacterales bacterium]|nr:glycosyl transferase [Desulfobacterales bacterium]